MGSIIASNQLILGEDNYLSWKTQTRFKLQTVAAWQLVGKNAAGTLPYPRPTVPVNTHAGYEVAHKEEQAWLALDEKASGRDRV